MAESGVRKRLEEFLDDFGSVYFTTEYDAHERLIRRNEIADEIEKLYRPTPDPAVVERLTEIRSLWKTYHISTGSVDWLINIAEAALGVKEERR